MPPRREPRVTIKSVVLAGVRDGLDFGVIADEIVRQFPGTKGALDPIRYIKYYVAESGMGPRQQEKVQEERAKHGFTRADWPPPNQKAVIEELIIEGVVVRIYRGLMVTFDAACNINRKDVFTLYKSFTGEYARPDAPFYRVHAAVIGEIQNLWYRAAGLPLPPRVETNQAQRLEDVKMAKPTPKSESAATAEAKEPRVTVKSVITSALIQGIPDDEIAAMVQEQFPTTKAAENPSQHISYYRSALVKAGQLEKQPRKTKAKTADGEGGDATPAKAAKPAKGKSAAAPAAAAPAKGVKKAK